MTRGSSALRLMTDCTYTEPCAKIFAQERTLLPVNRSSKSAPKIMAKWSFRIAAMLAFVASALSTPAQVVINEIMYHPASENVLEEYIELHNLAATNVNISGWRVAGGVDFIFPSNTILPANGYL